MQDIINWEEMEAKYVTGSQSYKELARLYGVSVGAAEKAGREGGWVAKRAKWRQEVASRAMDLAADLAANKLSRLMEAADCAVEALCRAMADEKQLYTYLVERSEKYSAPIEVDGKQVMERKWTEPMVTAKLDTKALRDLVAALRELTAITRDLYDTPGYLAREQNRRANEKLALDKQKGDAADSTLEVVWQEAPAE